MNYPTAQGDLSTATIVPLARLRWVRRYRPVRGHDRAGNEAVVGNAYDRVLQMLHEVNGERMWVDVETAHNETFEASCRKLDDEREAALVEAHDALRSNASDREKNNARAAIEVVLPHLQQS
jgi:hypothetical protein